MTTPRSEKPRIGCYDADGNQHRKTLLRQALRVWTPTSPDEAKSFLDECLARAAGLSSVITQYCWDCAVNGEDLRYGWFIRHYGDCCWELDAMNPNALRANVEEAIESLLDVDAWTMSQHTEAAQVETFKTV